MHNKDLVTLLQKMERKTRKHVSLAQHKNITSLSKYSRLAGHEIHYDKIQKEEIKTVMDM